MQPPHPTFSLDPRIRVGCAVLLSIVTALLARPIALLPLICCAIVLLLLVRPAHLKKRLAAVNLFIAFLWLCTPWSTPGTPLFAVGPLTITREGLDLAFLVTLKANCLVLFCTSLIAPLDTATLGHALRSLGLNEKLVFLLLFTERSFYILAREWHLLQEAAKLRGFYARCDRHSYQTLAKLIALLLLRSMDHAKKAHEALLLRGFTGVFFAPTPFHPRPIDALAALALLLPCVLALVLNVT